MNPLVPNPEGPTPVAIGAVAEKAFMHAAAVEECPNEGGGKTVVPGAAERVFDSPLKVIVLKSKASFAMESKSLGTLSTKSNGSLLKGGREGLDFEVSGNVLT
jgi:hypothetical protein